jgi:hypothetical protein
MAIPFIDNPQPQQPDPRNIIKPGLVFALGTLLTTALAPNTQPLPVGTYGNRAALEQLQVHGPSIRQYLNADTSQGSAKALIFPQLPPQLMWKEPWTAPDTQKRVALGPDTSHSWQHFYEGDGDGLDPFWQGDQIAAQYKFDRPPRIGSETSQSSPLALIGAITVQPLPPGQETPQSAPERSRWQPLDTTKSWPYFYYGDGDGADPLWQNNGLLARLDKAAIGADTSCGSPFVLTVAVAAPFTPAATIQVDRVRWQPADTSKSWPHFYEGDGDGADPLWQYQQQTAPDRVRPVADTSQSSAPILVAPPLVPAPIGLGTPQPVLERSRWQPLDTTRSWPHFYEGDGDGLDPLVNAPQFQVDRLRPVADTSQGTPPALQIITAVVQNVLFPTLDILRTVTDTSQSSPKVLYADATLPVQNVLFPTLDPVRLVVNTSQFQSPDLIPPAPTPPPIVVVAGSVGGGGGGGRALNQLFRRKDESPVFEGRKTREILDDMALPVGKAPSIIPAVREARLDLSVPPEDEDDDYLLLF